MADKHMKRVKQYFEDLLEGRDDLFKNVERLISTANLQVQSISISQASLSEKEGILTYLTKILVLFSELNTSVLKCLESVSPPVPVKAITHSSLQENHSKVQELDDYFKMDQSNMSKGLADFDFSKDGPKIPNDLVQNSSYVRKPLDDTTLKIICSTFINGNTSENLLPTAHNNSNILNSDIPSVNNVQVSEVTQLHRNGTKLNSRLSPTLSYCTESDVFSAISSGTYHHPLTKFHPPTEIPKQYDTSDLEKVKENMRYISRKMGFDSEGFAQMSNQFDKGLATIDYQYERPEKDVQQESPITGKETLESTPTTSMEPSSNSSEEHNVTTVVAENCNENLEELAAGYALLNNQCMDGPCRNTGAIRKQTLIQEDLIEFSGSTTSESGSSNKVAAWLTQDTQGVNKKPLISTESDPSENVHKNPSAIEKLSQIKRHDRNEEVREKAINDMPNLKLIPVETPKVIKNNLNSDSSSSEKNVKIRTTSPKLKEFNKSVCNYEIQKMGVPEVGAVCVFSHIVSPNEFYLQVLDDITSPYLDAVSTTLDEKFSKTESKFKTKQEACTRLGKFCYGYVWGERKAWYRLQVLDWKLDCSPDDVEVQSVDYGFKCTTRYWFLRELTSDLAHIPMLAIKAHFPLIYPPGTTYSNRLTDWSPSTVEALYDIANLSRDISTVSEELSLFEIIFAEQDGDSVGVDLVQFSEPDADSLGQLLIDMGLAIEIVDDYGENPELGDFFEDIDELERADNLNEFILGYDAKDEARICRFTRNDGSCYKGKHCKLEHIQLKDGYTTDKTAVFYTGINDLILPSKGDKVEILVTDYVDSCTYLVQMVRNSVEDRDANIVMDKDIFDLMSAMNHPKLVAKYVPFKIYPAIGEMVLAYHPTAKKWIRAAVRGLNLNDESVPIEVYSVDFGDAFFLNGKNIRMMQEEFMHVPFQVVQIYLDVYQHKKECNAKKAHTFFDKHILFKNFLAYVKSSDPPYKVCLTTFKGREIGPTLVKAGFAEPRTTDVFISEDKEKRGKFDLE